jgi:hypothetical protein
MKSTKRSAATHAAYLREGWRHLRRARKRHPEISDDAEALVTSLERDPEILARSTIPLYRAQHKAMLEVLRPTSPDQVAAYMTRVEAALARRRGKPWKPRRASLKVKGPPPEHVDPVLRELSRRVWKGEENALTLALAICLLVRLGHRPVEAVTARLQGAVLIIQNAKVNDSRALFTERRLDLRAEHPLVRRAITTFLPLLRKSVTASGSYDRWHAAASEMLARVCERAEVPRLCLSGFRHVTLSAWRRAGMAPWTLALLAGHASRHSASRYTRGEIGRWRFTGLPGADEIRVSLLEERARAREERARNPSKVESPTIGSNFVQPMPVPRNVPRADPDEGARLWKDWVAARITGNPRAPTNQLGTEHEQRCSLEVITSPRRG